MDTEVRFSTPRVYAFMARAAVWGLIFAGLYVLNSFFLLLFLTFVFAFIQSRLVAKLEPKIPNRTLRVWLVGIFVLLVIAGVGGLTFPAFKKQTQVFVKRLPEYLQTLDNEIVQLAQIYPSLAALLPEESLMVKAGVWEPQYSSSVRLFQQLMGFNPDANHQISEDAGKAAFGTLRKLGSDLAHVVSSFFLALLLSFLIVLDLPRLSESVRGLSQTRLGFVYREVAPNIRDFGATLGSALEAQLLIAALNALLTAIGLSVLGLSSKMVFLCTVVFICGFIPILGVFISSVPICLMALQESGIGLMLLCVLMITAVHMIEAYILNPKIYGHRLHMNPVLVLIILTIGGKLFHIWGLLLGLPLCTYIFGHAIRYRPRAPLS